MSDTPASQPAPTQPFQAAEPVTTPPASPPAPETPFAPPGFAIMQELGRGGMGRVYLARQTALNRLVALKVILAGRDADPEVRERFTAEARAVARLRHPHIVQVHELGTHEGIPYLALEYVPGGSLDRALGGQPLPPADAARLLVPLAEAVQHAHEQGVIHRDLKPANILGGWGVGWLGGLKKGAEDPAAPPPNHPTTQPPNHPTTQPPKITDFGLAKTFDADHGQTRTGAILGTPRYMAPEQAAGAGRHVGPAVDLWALGVILYELLTGRVPFQGATVLDTLDLVRTAAPVPPRQLQPTVPRDLETICLKCLRKEPARRYASARELADDLTRFLRGEPIRARPVGGVERAWRWCRRNPLAAGLILVAALALVAGAGVSAWYAYLADRRAAEAEANGAEARRLLAHVSIITGERLARDGDAFAALAWFTEPLIRDPDNRGQAVLTRQRVAAYRRLNPALVQMVVADAPITAVAVSPDGTRLLTVSAGTVRLWDLATGQAVGPGWTHAGEVESAVFSRDGCRVAINGPGERGPAVRLGEVATGKPLGPPVAEVVPSPAGYGAPASLSPDGRTVVRWHPEGAQCWDGAANLAAGPVLPHAGRPLWAAWTPDGQRLMTGDTTTIHHWEVATGRRLASVPSPPGQPLAVSPQGTQVLISDTLVDLRTGATRRLAVSQGQPPLAAVFRPDGAAVAVGGEDEVRVWDTATGAPLGPPIAYAAGVNALAFSPDGRTLLTGAYSDKQARLWDPVTGEPLSPWLTHGGYLTAVAFHPDGRRLVTAGLEGTARVWDLAGQGPRPLRHPGSVTAAAFSPDGRRLLTGGADGTVRIWDRGTRRPLGPPLRHPRAVLWAKFAGDGSLVVACTGDAEQRGGPIGDVRAWDWAAAAPLGAPIPFAASVDRVALHAPSARLLVAQGPNVQEYDLRTGKPRGVPWSLGRDVRRLLFRADGLLAAAELAPADGAGLAVRFWDVAAASPAPATLTLGAAEEERRVWGLAPTGAQVLVERSRPQVHGYFMELSGSLDVWDAPTGIQVGRSIPFTSAIRQAAFSPDGGHVAFLTHRDGIARVWDWRTGQPAAPPMAYQMVGWDLHYAADGRRIVTVAMDGNRTQRCEVRVWDAATGQPLTPPLRHAGVVHQAVLSPDGEALLTVGDLGQALLWDLTPAAAPVPDLVQTAQLANSGRSLDPVGGFAALPTATLRAAWSQERPPVIAAAAWHRREAEAAHRAGQWSAALTHADYALALDPDDPAPWVDKAAALRRLGHDTAAALAYARALRLAPDLVLAWHRQEGEALKAQGRWGAALFQFTRARELGDQRWTTRFFRATALAQLERWTEAATAYQEGADDHLGEYAGWYHHALFRLHAGDADGYRRACRTALERYGETADANAAHWIARACLLGPEAGVELAAVQRLVEKANNVPSFQPAYDLGDLALTALLLQLRSGKLDGRLVEVGPGVTLGPRDELLRALVHLRQGQPEAARAAQARALAGWEAKPGERGGWNHRLEFLVLRCEVERALTDPAP